MPVSAAASADGEVTIYVEGRFDFSAHRQFRQVHEDHRGEGKNFVVDMTDAEYMDSSALGMLLILREGAGGQRSNVRIKNCRGELRDVLAIANFDKLFEID